MNIGFIGAGKVGTAFGKYLANNHFSVKGYYSRSKKSAERAADFTDSNAYCNINDLTQHSDIIFITTNDDEISRVCKVLINGDLLTQGQILVHMSGASSSRILEGAKERGCFIYSLHPLQAFADIGKAVEDLHHTVFSIEGDCEKIHVLQEILESTGNKYFNISSDQKSIYHAAACVVSNYLVTLMDYGLSLFEAIGINNHDGFKALYPLIEGSLKNIASLGTKEALTGPIARGDVKTIEGHIEAIGDIFLKELDFYKLMGSMTLDLAKSGKLNDRNKAEKMEEILGDRIKIGEKISLPE